MYFRNNLSLNFGEIDMTTKISVWKKYENGIISCDYGDKDACQWDVHYSGAYCGMPLIFDNEYQASRTARALTVTFEEGKKQQLVEFRHFIGIK